MFYPHLFSAFSMSDFRRAEQSLNLPIYSKILLENDQSVVVCWSPAWDRSSDPLIHPLRIGLPLAGFPIAGTAYLPSLLGPQTVSQNQKYVRLPAGNSLFQLTYKVPRTSDGGAVSLPCDCTLKFTGAERHRESLMSAGRKRLGAKTPQGAHPHVTA